MTNDTDIERTLPVRESPSGAVAVHSDVLRGFYAATLLELPPEQVISFWRRHMPAPAGVRSAEWERFDGLLDGHAPADIASVVSALDGLAEYLCENGRAPLGFLQETAMKVNRGLPVSPGLLLKACSAFIRSLVRARDMRAFIVDHLQDFADAMAGGLGHRLVSRRVQDDWVTDLVALWGPRSRDGAVSEWALPTYDCGLWTMAMVAMSPIYLGMPPFEEPSMLCDARGISEILPDATVDSEGRVMVEGHVVATLVPWEAFRARRELPDECAGADARRVAVVHAEVVCPRCGRILLHEGCGYGAPLYMYTLRYRHLSQELSEPVFRRIVGEALDGRLLNREAARQHKAVIERVRRKLVVVYHAADESVSVDGRHIVRSVPAKMLRRMVRAYAETGQTEFEYREFCRDDSMDFDPMSPNISVRVQRLVKTLEASCDGLRVTRIARGRCLLESRFPVEYREEEPEASRNRR